MDRAVYPQYVLISILVDGLAVVTIVLTLNPSFFLTRELFLSDCPFVSAFLPPSPCLIQSP